MISCLRSSFSAHFSQFSFVCCLLLLKCGYFARTFPFLQLPLQLFLLKFFLAKFVLLCCIDTLLELGHQQLLFRLTRCLDNLLIVELLQVGDDGLDHRWRLFLFYLLLATLRRIVDNLNASVKVMIAVWACVLSLDPLLHAHDMEAVLLRTVYQAHVVSVDNLIEAD